ncbi:hypothetical protein CUJ83_02935 [Methanocella sp. CWC-04]|uniref:Uncharacterized protein n=1 Tax=Methanooceanicella nereidis TaxID=2052831 RepID=A0AAP2W6C9_9EURY|nr:nitrophenyl compound nitroreductase subunit ArsF family protein [Methanocella sp. CWC-04]MCD1293951.1 hypothetical protein [Methanocella sp. CWC-04]
MTQKDKAKNLLAIMLICFVLISIVFLVFKHLPDDSGAQAVKGSGDIVGIQGPANKVVVYYFYTNARCTSCLNMESYTEQALMEGFPKEISDGTLEWHAVNIDKLENRHYIKDYDLYIKSVIVSGIRDGKEVNWKNLDRVWELLGDKSSFIRYVQENTKEYLEDI